MSEHPIAFAVVALVAFVLGGLIASRIDRFVISRRTWRACKTAATRIAMFVGNPAIHRSMHERFRGGHRWDLDREFRADLEHMLALAFGLDDGHRRDPRA